MFKNYSSEQAGRIVSTIFMLLALFGYKVQQETGVGPEQFAGALDSIILSVSLIGGVVLNVIGYFRRYFKGKDVTILGFRK